MKPSLGFLPVCLIAVVLGAGCLTPVCDPTREQCGGADSGVGGGGGSAGGGAAGGGAAGGEGGGSAGGEGGGAGGAGGGGGTGGGTATCAPACTGGTFCDAATTTCVSCTATQGCSGTTPICDLSAPGGQCVGCLSNASCSGTTPLCDPLSRKCVGCLVEGDCQNPTPLCSAAKTCVGCTSATGCGAGKNCSPSGACEATPETCVTPQTLPLPALGATTTFDVDTALATDDTQGSCNATGGGELVYRLAIPAATSLTLTASRPPGSLANPVLYVRAAPCSTAAELACSNAPSPTATETISISNQPAGDYFLFVEGVGANVGLTRLTMTVSLPNDSCAGAKALSFVGTIATTTGDTTLASNSNTPNDVSPTCSPSGSDSGKDLVYTYTLSAAQDVSITATATGASPSYKPVVYVRKPGACSSSAVPDEVGCDSSGTEPQGTPARLQLRNQPPGVYFLYVDSAQDTKGTFALDVVLSPATLPPSNDGCPGAHALNFTGGIAAASGDTTQATNSNAANDPTPSCSPSAQSSGKDVVYTYILTTAQDVELTATPKSTSPDFSPVIYVRKTNACASSLAGDELGCDSTASTSSGTAAHLVFLNQQPGTYSVFVDGALDTVGGFNLDVGLSAPTLPPSNDSCSAPIILTVGGAARMGNNTQAANDYSSTSTPPYSTACNNFGYGGSDLVYQFTATTTGTVQATVTPGAGFDPALLLLTGSCSPAACLSAVDTGFTADPETLSISAVAGQTYFLVVDNYSSSASSGKGTFTIQVQ
ncbi:MAG: Alkaline serine protease [Myxococcaceae bacterium]|nr:Alkaline serine protease [Myxococcaceae bacterium]